MSELVDALQSLNPTIGKILAVSASTGLSLGVVHHGHIIHTAHYGRQEVSKPSPPNDDTIYRILSLTKIMTASVVGALVDEGILSWDVPIREYLPTFNQRRDELGMKATVRDLLACRTGIAVANAMYGQQRGEFLLPKSEMVRMTCYLDAVKPFREAFVYSQWNYALVTELVEKVTGKSLGTNIRDRILEPLGMSRTTLGNPDGDNIASAYASGNDGTPHQIPFPNLSDHTGLGGGAGAKSTIKDLLLMYRSLLCAYNHQNQNDSVTTPGSPFKHLKTIFSPHVGVGGSHIDDVAYCLGLYRTRLPGNLSIASINNLLLGPSNTPRIGTESPGLEIYHHTGNFTGFVGSVFLIPSSESAVVVITNSLPLMDPTDFIGQSIVSLLLGEHMQADLLKLAKMACSASLASYQILSAQLAQGRTGKPHRFSLAAYEGDYYNVAGNFVISITAQPSGLRMTVQGMRQIRYDLLPYDGDTFYWPANREEELCRRGMWPFTRPGWHKIVFETSDNAGIHRLIWKHDPLAKPEVFRKLEDSSKIERGKL